MCWKGIALVVSQRTSRQTRLLVRLRLCLTERSFSIFNRGIRRHGFSLGDFPEINPHLCKISNLLSAKNMHNLNVEKIHLEESQVADMKLAASKMKGPSRRAFQAAMAVKYCAGSARQTELKFGWSRHTVQLGLHETRRGIVCLSSNAAFGGNLLWEERHPDVAKVLMELAQAHSQQDPTFRTTLSYTRLTSAEALRQLLNAGFAKTVLPSPSAMATILNRNGYRLRPVVKAKPQRKSPKRTPSSPTSEKKTGGRVLAARPSA